MQTQIEKGRIQKIRDRISGLESKSKFGSKSQEVHSAEGAISGKGQIELSYISLLPTRFLTPRSLQGPCSTGPRSSLLDATFCLVLFRRFSHVCFLPEGSLFNWIQSQMTLTDSEPLVTVMSKLSPYFKSTWNWLEMTTICLFLIS